MWSKNFNIFNVKVLWLYYHAPSPGSEKFTLECLITPCKIFSCLKFQRWTLSRHILRWDFRHHITLQRKESDWCCHSNCHSIHQETFSHTFFLFQKLYNFSNWAKVKLLCIERNTTMPLESRLWTGFVLQWIIPYFVTKLKVKGPKKFHSPETQYLLNAFFLVPKIPRWDISYIRNSSISEFPRKFVVNCQPARKCNLHLLLVDFYDGNNYKVILSILYFENEYGDSSSACQSCLYLQVVKYNSSSWI